MEIWQGILDFVFCWIKLTAIGLSVPLGLSLLYRYCGAYYVLEREQRKMGRKRNNEKIPNDETQ